MRIVEVVVAMGPIRGRQRGSPPPTTRKLVNNRDAADLRDLLANAAFRESVFAGLATLEDQLIEESMEERAFVSHLGPASLLWSSMEQKRRSRTEVIELFSREKWSLQEPRRLRFGSAAVRGDPQKEGSVPPRFHEKEVVDGSLKVKKLPTLRALLETIPVFCHDNYQNSLALEFLST